MCTFLDELAKYRFEQSSAGLVPRRDVDSSMEDTGFALGYCLLQGGPNFGLAPHVYDYLAGYDSADISLSNLPETAARHRARNLVLRLQVK